MSTTYLLLEGFEEMSYEVNYRELENQIKRQKIEQWVTNSLAFIVQGIEEGDFTDAVSNCLAAHKHFPESNEVKSLLYLLEFLYQQQVLRETRRNS